MMTKSQRILNEVWREATRLFLLILLVLCGSGNARAQLNIDSLHEAQVCTASGLAVPNITGMPRPKGIEVYHELQPTAQLVSRFDRQGLDYTSKIERIRSWMVKVRGPIVNNDGFKLIVGLRYYHQEFYFENPGALNNEFHESLQDKDIRSAGLSLNGIKSFVGKSYLLSQFTLRLNGDFAYGNPLDHIKISLSALYGIKSNAQRTWGFGASYSNSLGRSSFYPILFYTEKFKSKWAVQALLPVSVQLLYLPNDRNVFSLNTRLEGDNYNLDFQTLVPQTMYLEQADVKTFIAYDREIYDFLWLGISAGMRFNINFAVSDADLYFNRTIPFSDTEHTVISNDLSSAPFFRVGLFMVPPRKWLDQTE